MRYRSGVIDLQHVTEEKPGLWERFADTKRRYLVFVEAVVFELGAHGKVVLSGRGTTILLRTVPHVLRVRITAPEATRIARVQQQYGVPPQVETHSPKAEGTGR